MDFVGTFVAGTTLSILLEEDPSTLLARTVPGGAAAPSFGLKPDLGAHLAMLADEFSGRPMLGLAHAAAIVLVRRGLDEERSTARFFQLWDEQAEVLLEILDMRWLVSAADTIADHGRSAAERGLALSASVFVNLLKLAETERVLTKGRGIPETYEQMADRIELFDGVSAFVVGRGDMVANLYRRAQRVAAEGETGPAGAILREVMRRAVREDTVVGRFRARHLDTETLW